MENNSNRPLSAREWELIHHGRHFSDIFPVRMRGRIVYKQVRGFCNVCRGPIADSNTFAAKSEPITGVVVIEGVGRCLRCRVFTPFYFRIHSDGIIDGPHPVDGRWARWDFRIGSGTPAWWDLIGWLRRAVRPGRSG